MSEGTRTGSVVEWVGVRRTPRRRCDGHRETRFVTGPYQGDYNTYRGIQTTTTTTPLSRQERLRFGKS